MPCRNRMVRQVQRGIMRIAGRGRRDSPLNRLSSSALLMLGLGPVLEPLRRRKISSSNLHSAVRGISVYPPPFGCHQLAEVNLNYDSGSGHKVTS